MCDIVQPEQQFTSWSKRVQVTNEQPVIVYTFSGESNRRSPCSCVCFEEKCLILAVALVSIRTSTAATKSRDAMLDAKSHHHH
jgi:hypothetical protein